MFGMTCHCPSIKNIDFFHSFFLPFLKFLADTPSSTYLYQFSSVILCQPIFNSIKLIRFHFFLEICHLLFLFHSYQFSRFDYFDEEENQYVNEKPQSQEPTTSTPLAKKKSNN